jgi:hypothetical protein
VDSSAIDPSLLFLQTNKIVPMEDATGLLCDPIVQAWIVGHFTVATMAQNLYVAGRRMSMLEDMSMLERHMQCLAQDIHRYVQYLHTTDMPYLELPPAVLAHRPREQQ